MPLNLSRLEEQMILSYHRNSELAWRWNSKGTFISSFRCCRNRRLLMALSFLHKDLATDPCKRLLAFTNCRYYDIIDYKKKIVWSNWARQMRKTEERGCTGGHVVVLTAETTRETFLDGMHSPRHGCTSGVDAVHSWRIIGIDLSCIKTNRARKRRGDGGTAGDEKIWKEPILWKQLITGWEGGSWEGACQQSRMPARARSQHQKH